MTADNIYPSPEKKSRFFYGYTVAGAALIIMLLSYGMRTSFGVFFKPMEAEFGWTRALISGTVTLSLIVQGLWGIYMGRINDLFGSRRVITLSTLLLALGFLLIATTCFSWQLYLFYGVLIGLGMGGFFVALMSTISRWFIKRRGLMTGIVMAGIGVGTLAIAPLSTWLISLYGWRTANVILGLIVLFAGLAAARFLKRDPFTMGLTPLGQGEIKAHGTTADTHGLNLKKSAGTWQFWVVGAIFACVGYCTFTMNVHLVPHLTDLGITPATASVLLGISGIVQSAAGIVLGGVADKIGSRLALIISFILLAVSLFWLVSIHSTLAFYLFGIVYGCAIGGSTAMESPITAELFGMKAHGVVLGALAFGFTIGAAIGPAVTGYLFDLSGNYKAAFLISAGVGVAGLVLTGVLRPVKKLNIL